MAAKKLYVKENKKSFMNIIGIKDNINFNKVDVIEEEPRYSGLQSDLNQIQSEVESFLNKIESADGHITSKDLSSKDYKILTHCKLNLGLTINSQHLYIIDRFEKDENYSYFAICHEFELLSNLECKGISDGTTFDVKIQKVQSKKIDLDKLVLIVKPENLDVTKALLSLSESTLIVDYYNTSEINSLIKPISDEIISNIAK